MKRSYWKMLLREFRHSVSRFLAIFAIVALGVGFLAGLLATTPDMRASADRYYDDTDMMDVRVVGTMGLTKDDVAKALGADGVEDGMAAYTQDALVTLPNEDTLVARIQSLPVTEGKTGLENAEAGYLNRLTVTEGRLPENAGECVLRVEKYYNNQFPIGSSITLSDENTEELDENFRTKTFAVVGYVKSSYYMSIEKESSSIGSGAVSLFLFVPETDFTMDVYTDLFLTVHGAKAIDSLAEADLYDSLTAPVITQMEDLGRERSVLRLDEIKADAQTELDDSRTEYEDKKAEAESKLSDARKELDDGWTQLSDAKQQTADGLAALQTAKDQIAGAPEQIAESERTIDEKEQELQDGQKAYDAGKADFDRQKNDAESALAGQQSQLDAKEAEYQSQKQALDDAKEQLDGAKAQIDAAKLQIAQLRALGLTDQADALEAALAPKEAEYSAGLQAYTDNKARLDGARGQLDDASLQLQEARDQANAQFQDAQAKLTATKQQLDDGWAQLADGKAQLQSAKDELQAGLSQIEDNEKKLGDAQKEIDDSKKKLEDGEAEYLENQREADSQLSEAKEKLEDAQKQIDDLETPEWYVLGRDKNVSYVSFTGNAEKIAAIAQVFPIFFFLVAALVVLTTVTRMVDEQRTQIGVMKALGYGKGKIAAQYLIYSAAATVTGSLFGLLVGFNLFPTIIWNAYSIMYDLPNLIVQFNVKYALLASGTAVAITLLAAFWACYSSLRETPALLILPKAPKNGKRILLERVTPLWSRLTFIHKVTARNLFRYKKRLLMTVIGIAGCTALLVTGFGLQDSISDIVDLQFGQVQQYNLTVTGKDADDMKNDPDVQSILSDGSRVDRFLRISQESGDVQANGKSLSAYLTVPEETQRLKDFVTLRERKSEQQVAFDEGAVLLTEKLAETLGVTIGDTISVADSDNKTAQLRVGGILENYVQNYVYLSPALYEEAYHSPPDYSQTIAVVPDSTQANRDQITSELLSADSVRAVSFTNDVKGSFTNTIQSIGFIVVVLILSAGLLAFVVLYNLTNINITERQKEIGTIKVLGFFDKEVSAYIYRETAILTLIGTAVGLVFGIFLHAFVVRTAEVDMVMFGRVIKWASYVYSALLTIAFSAVVNLVMYKKLKNVSMVESMKSTE